MRRSSSGRAVSCNGRPSPRKPSCSKNDSALASSAPARTVVASHLTMIPWGGVGGGIAAGFNKEVVSVLRA